MPSPLQRLLRHTRLIGWYLRDGVGRFRMLGVGIVVCEFVALLAQANAIALTIYYAYLLSEGGTVSVLGRTVEPRGSLQLLGGCAAVVLVMLLVAALLQFAARTWTLALRRRYAEHCTRRVLRILAGPMARLPRTREPLHTGAVVRLARADAIKCGRIAALLVGTATPAATLALATAVLLLINLPLTLIVGGLAVFSAWFLYKANLRGAAAARDCEIASRDAGAEVRAVVGAAAADVDHAEVGDLPRSRRYLDQYVRRLKAADESELISNLFLALVFATILVGLGWQVIREGRGWEVMAAYLVALRYGLISFRTCARRLTALNRFHPQARRHRDFVIDAATPGHENVRTPTSFRLRAGRRAVEGSQRRASLAPGQRLRIITPVSPNRLTIPFLLRAVMPARRGQAAAAIGASHWLRPDDRSHDLLASARQLAAAGSPRLVIVAEDDLKSVADGARDELDRILDDHVLAIVALPPRHDFLGAGEDLVAVCDTHGAVALASPDWMRLNWPSVAMHLDKLSPAGAGADEDDVED